MMYLIEAYQLVAGTSAGEQLPGRDDAGKGFFQMCHSLGTWPSSDQCRLAWFTLSKRANGRDRPMVFFHLNFTLHYFIVFCLFVFVVQSSLREVNPCLCPQGHKPVFPFRACVEVFCSAALHGQLQSRDLVRLATASASCAGPWLPLSLR